jgi:hypothetical protein
MCIELKNTETAPIAPQLAVDGIGPAQQTVSVGVLTGTREGHLCNLIAIQ